MDLSEQLRVLEAAQGDAAKLALATIDLAYPALPEAQRAVLKGALQAAAIPHWCDEAILTAMLDVSSAEGAAQFAHLDKLRVVEPFPARGLNAVNVHEVTRLELRKRMAADDPALFRLLSKRLVAHFAEDSSPAGRIEWLYHLMSAEPGQAALECEALNRKWIDIAHPEDHRALAMALGELEACGLVSGAARIEALLCVIDARSMRGETAALEPIVRQILDLARAVGVASGEAHASCQLGDSLQAQGKLGKAQAAYSDYLRTVSRNLALEPDDNRWRRRLVVAHGRMGRVLTARGRLPKGRDHFGKGLRLCRQFALSDPANVSWQLLLATAHSDLGDVLQSQGKLPEAQVACVEALAINRRLAEQDPTNSAWQQSLAWALNRVGDILEAQGNLVEAHGAFAESLAIHRRLAEHDPDNADWQRDLALGLSRVIGVFQAQGRLGAAQTGAEEYLAISRRLAERDPANATWRRDLAHAYSRVGDILEAQGNLVEAHGAFAESLAIQRRLAEHDSGNADCQYDLAVALSRVGHLSQAQGDTTEAQEVLADCLAISRRLAERDPANARWQRNLAEAHSIMGDMLVTRAECGDWKQALRHYQDSLDLTERLLKSNRESAEAAHDLQVYLERIADVRLLLDDAQRALQTQERAVEVGRELWQRNHRSWDIGRHLAVSFYRASQLASEANAERLAAKYRQDCYEVLDAFAGTGSLLDDEMRNLYEQLKALLPRSAE